MRSFTPDLKQRRHDRVKELVRQQLSEILRREVKDPRTGMLTVTEVDLKADLRSATVFVSKLISSEGEVISEEQQADILDGLESASHYIYEQLKRRLVMKVVPSIRFVYDTRLDGLSQIWHLIGEVSERSQAAQIQNQPTDSEGSENEVQLSKN